MAGRGPTVERVTESFYAWELRGRGWTLAPYPVDLEPPHRPFFVLPDPAAALFASIDDGKRPTLLSSLIEGVQRAFGPSPPRTEVLASEPFEEQQPFPSDPDTDSSRAAFRISIPADFRSDPELATAIIRSLLRSTQPASFEVIGHAGAVTLQFTTKVEEAAHVESMLAGFLPDATIVQSDDLLPESWRSEQPSLIIDLGLANEFFLPIKVERSFAIDPLIPLVAALAEARSGETLALQVLFQRSVNGWPKTICEALIDEAGDDIFLDAPHFTTLAKEKTETPIVAVVLRLAARAKSSERVHSLVRSALSSVAQFERGGGNAFIPLANDDYDDADHARAFLHRESFRTGMLLSVDELAQLVHLPDRSVRTHALVRQSKRTKALPSVAEGHQLVLGTNVHRGVEQLASVQSDARLAHMHVIGASGTGKSTLLLSLITQDIRNGHGVLVLDPHGDLVDDVLARIPDERWQDVCLFDPADPDNSESAVGFNVLSAGSEVEKQLIASDIVSTFRRLATSWGDAMTTVLGNAVLALLEHPAGGTLVELRRFLIDDAYRRQVLTGIPDPHVRFFWEKEYPLIGSRSIGPILTRLDQFLRPKLLRRVVGQQHGKLDVAMMVAERRIVLAKLSQGQIGTENAYLLGSLLVAKLHQVALARQRLAQSTRHPFYCYVDECQHFVGESMASLLSEARKYGVGFTLAHQTLAQLSHSPSVAAALLGNAYTRIMFRIGDDDAKKLAEGCSFFAASDLRSLARADAVVRLGSEEHDFNLRVLPCEEVPEDEADARSEEVRALSRANFGTVRSELLDALPMPMEAARPPQAVRADPVPTLAAPTTTTNAPSSPTHRPKPRVVTRDGPTLGRGGKVHKYLQHLVKRLAEERGFRATIEDPGADGTSVDVVLRRGEQLIGVEISITTSVEHEVENLKKCAGLALTHVLFIANEKAKRERVAAAAQGMFTGRSFTAVAPEDIVSALDALAEPAIPTESTVRGYKVRVSRQLLTPADVLAKRKAVAGVIARNLKTT